MNVLTIHLLDVHSVVLLKSLVIGRVSSSSRNIIQCCQYNLAIVQCTTTAERDMKGNELLYVYIYA